jgi:hypothetical protein
LSSSSPCPFAEARYEQASPKRAFSERFLTILSKLLSS